MTTHAAYSNRNRKSLTGEFYEILKIWRKDMTLVHSCVNTPTLSSPSSYFPPTS